MAVKKKAVDAEEKPKKKRGRPAKKGEKVVIEKRKAGRKKALPQSEIEEIKSVAAAARIEVEEGCPVCAFGEKKREKIEEALLVVTAGGVSKEGDSTFTQIASRYQVESKLLLRHRDRCMKREAVLALEKTGGGNEVENSAAWISKLAKYLDEVDRVLERENMQLEPDARVILAGAEEGRKICETNAKMFIDLYKLRVDQKVQDDFMRIVLDVVDQVAPQAKEMIVEKLKGRLAIATAGGARGAVEG